MLPSRLEIGQTALETTIHISSEHEVSLPQITVTHRGESKWRIYSREFKSIDRIDLWEYLSNGSEKKILAVKEKISYMSPGHSSWPGYNRELLLGRRRPPTKKDILSFTLNHGLSFFSFPSDLYT